MEAKEKYEEEILRRVQALPEEQLAKVTSLMDKLQEEEKKKKAEAYQKAIDRAWGAFKDVPGSVDDFMRRKREEKNLDR